LLLPLLGLSPRETQGQGAAEAEDAKKDFSHLSIEDLMNLKTVTVYGPSRYQQKVTESPASVTIIAADKIEKCGYRTLSDVLQSMPGFYTMNDRNYSNVGVEGIFRLIDYNRHLLIKIEGHRVYDNIFNGASVRTPQTVLCTAANMQGARTFSIVEKMKASAKSTH
jgi:hypothetical protein